MLYRPTLCYVPIRKRPIDRISCFGSTLIAQYNQMKNENKSLKIKQDALVKEKAKLLEKTTLAKARVEAMIARLKAMEHDS